MVEGTGRGPSGPLLSVNPSAYGRTASAVLRVRNGVPTRRLVRDVDYQPLLGGAPGEGDAPLLRQATAARLLTLQRNAVGGAVHRSLGTWDVLALSRETVGLCRHRDCTDPTAVDVLGSRRTDYYSAQSVPLLLYTPPSGNSSDGRGGGGGGGALPLHVRMDDEDLLCLGRAALSDPSWLPATAAPLWRLRAGFTLHASSADTTAGQSPVVEEPLGGALWTRKDTVGLGNTSAAARAVTEKWLQAVSYVYCGSPLSSFVRGPAGRPGRLCGPTADDVAPEPRRGGQSVRKLHTAQWSFDPDLKARDVRPPEDPIPPGGELPPCPTFRRRTNDPAVLRVARPAWLAGRAAREVNPASAAEVALARSISTCAYNVTPEDHDAFPFKPFTRMKWSAEHTYAPLLAATRELSEGYDRQVWGVEPPAEAASDADIVLSIIVVLPEAIALVALLLSSRGRMWAAADWAAFALIWVAGAVSVGGIITLALEERAGHVWRAAAVRTELTARLHTANGNNHYRHFDRTPLFQVETLLLVARLGYRHRLLRDLAVAMGTLYLLLSAAVAVAAFLRSRVVHSRAAAGPPLYTPEGGDEAVGGGVGAGGTTTKYRPYPRRRRSRWPRLPGRRPLGSGRGGAGAVEAGSPGTDDTGV